MQTTLAESTDSPLEVVDDLEELLAILPDAWRTGLGEAEGLDRLIEVVCDLGRTPEARFPDEVRALSVEPVTRRDLEAMGDRVGEFASDNRAGIERTLHRISALRNRRGAIVGLTCRVGRAVYGTIEPVRDVFESGPQRAPGRATGGRQDDAAARRGATSSPTIWTGG